MQYNNDFLKQLDEQQEITNYVEIISLDINDNPLEIIQGKTNSGSVNIDGKSALRRTCSLSFVAKENDLVITDSYWCFNTKFKLRIGKENRVNTSYPPIIWFDMGIYIITSFNFSKTTKSLSISIQGKDKMCRLNGEVDGNISATTDFGQIEEVNFDDPNNPIYTLKKIPIKDIIFNAVKDYGKEKASNIIIRDLDEVGYELWEYRGEEPMYYFMEVDTGNIKFLTQYQDMKVLNESNVQINISNIPKYYSTNTLDENYNSGATRIKLIDDTSQTKYFIIKIEGDQPAGYKSVPLVYGNDLILKTGETITNMLDKLVSMLGNYEYFYDVYGRFVFQRKNDYIQELFSTSSGVLETPIMHNEKYSYIFNDNQKFTNISVSPNIGNVKNDFVVEGERKTTAGQSFLLHARCAIDKKPQAYTSPWEKYIKINPDKVDSQSNEQFYIKTYTDQTKTEYVYTEISFPFSEENKSKSIYIKRIMETIYSTQTYDWRELIYQMSVDFLKHGSDSDFLIRIQQANPEFINGVTGYEQYYTDINSFWRLLYCPIKYDASAGYGIDYYYDDNDSKKWWNKAIHSDPTTLTFWFEFIDTNGELNKYSVNKIGRRSKQLNEKEVNSIYYTKIPEVQFVIATENDPSKVVSTAYTEMQITKNDKQLFAKSARGASAIDKINEAIQNYTACSQTVNITSIPIYYLQPNTRIQINNQECPGDYVLDKISYNLSYNGTMTLNLTKVLEYFV